MPRKRNGEIPLPDGWDYGRDYDGKIYFIDHNTKKTTWMDPRDRFTKPQSFADCIGNELPLGWEEAFDGHIGRYYINHVNQSTQLEDPRQEWRVIQEAMLREYLQTAQDVLEAKKDIYNVKSQRLILAQDEYNHLSNALTTLTTSRTSLCSSTSSVSTKYDPDLLKSDVALAKNRVSRLKSELEQIRNEMTYTQKGVDTLTTVEQKLASHQGTCYNIAEAQAIMVELRHIQRSLSSGEKEKADLMQSLAKLKDDLTRLQLSESSLDVSTLSLPQQEKLSTASQTDLSCELMPIGTRLAEMAKMRLEYDESRKRVQHIQQQLTDLEDKVQPGQVESDKDRLLLFQEKEQLLRELRSITPRMRSKEEMSGIQMECKRLEHDLNQALEMSNRTIADRLRLHEEKQLLLQQLRDGLRQMTHLESQLKTLSASTLSVSSSSSLGSLSTTSSKGSLNSCLSFTDIYGAPHYSSTQTIDKPIDMVDLHRRVERLLRGTSISETSPSHTSSPGRSQPSLSPRSSLSSVSPPVSPMYENLPPYSLPPPPTYEQVERDRRLQHEQKQLLLDEHHRTTIDYIQLRMPATTTNPSVSPLTDLLEAQNMSQGSGLGRPTSATSTTTTRYSYESSTGGDNNNQLSPISETPPPPQDLDNLIMPSGTTLSRTSSSGTNTRSVSAAVSDESVAGDSGVFEASHRKRGATGGSQLFANDQDTAQIQLKLRYTAAESVLNVCVERARNLTALFIADNVHVYLKIALLPTAPAPPTVYNTKLVNDLKKACFGDVFHFTVPVNKICTKTLQLNVWSRNSDDVEKCVGCAQVSLADFNVQTTTQKWYNILSLQLMTNGNSPNSENHIRNSNNNKSNVMSNGPKTTINYHNNISTNNNNNNNNNNNIISTTANDLVLNNNNNNKIDSDCQKQSAIGSKEESSDDSTIISSQTSTLTRNQESGNLLPAAINLNYEELVNCLRNSSAAVYNTTDDEDDEVEDEEDDSEEIDDDVDDEDELLEEIIEEVPLDDEYDEREKFTDKQTNTECAFYPEHAKQMKITAAGGHLLTTNIIKRSQTFSPHNHHHHHHHHHHHYVCKLNRSDSDSAMPLYHRAKSFERNAVERRSLRFRRQSNSLMALTCNTTNSSNNMNNNSSGAVVPSSGGGSSAQGGASSSGRTSNCHLLTTARTSLDLELDLRAQHTRLDLLNGELQRLRELKGRLEMAKEHGDVEVVSGMLEDEQFQEFISYAENCSRTAKTVDEKRVEKMLRKISREIYKLRKSKAGNGKPDLISFKEKMAFFTRVNTNVPFLPSSEECHLKTMVTPSGVESTDMNEPMNSLNGNNTPSPSSGSDSSINSVQNTQGKTHIGKTNNNTTNGDDDIDDDGDDHNQKKPLERYEYVVDRVLGVEV